MLREALQPRGAEAAIRGRSRAAVVESLSDVTWFVPDGAARTPGVHVDPDAEFSQVMNDLAPGLAR